MSSWDTDLSQLLNELLTLQTDLLNLLSRKRELLVTADATGLAAMATDEEALIRRLEQWLEGREQLLDRAAEEGLPKTNLRSLASRLPQGQKNNIEKKVRQANLHANLIRHQALTNWVAIQRTIIHLSQMLEIIATGGRLQPTYGGGGAPNSSGSLVDRAA
jgi:hypothetical protein